MFHFCVRLIVLRTPMFIDFFDGLFVRATRGAKMLARLGINFRTKFTIPSTDLNFLIFLGIGKLTSFYAILTNPNSIGG